MGKTKKFKNRSNTINPLGAIHLDGIDFNELNGRINSENNQSGGPIAPIVEQLQSAKIDEKLCGLQTLSTLCQHNVNIPLIIESDLVRIAAPFLVDRNMNLRHATAGALRNLSACGVEICEILVEQDVLTPLLTLLNEYANSHDWVPRFDKDMSDQIDQRSDTFLQAVNIVWNLCESSSIALEFFNQSLLLQSFIRELNWNIYGYDIAIAVAQCLLVISEDNPTCWKILFDSSTFFGDLLAVDRDKENKFSSTILRTLSAGIMSNVPALTLPYLNQIILSLSKTLDINHRIVLGKLTSILPIDGIDGEGYEIEESEDNIIDMEEENENSAVRRRRKADLPNETDIEVKNVERLLEAQRIAAETLTNLCSSDEEEIHSNDEEDMSDVESVHDYDKSTHSSSSNIQNVDRIPVEIQEAIKALGLVEKLWQRAQPIADNVNEMLNETKPSLMKKIKKLRISSILCLQNLCNSLTTEDLGGPTAIYAVWLDLGQQAFQGPQDIESLEATTALMRAALEHLKSSPDSFKQMTINDLELMLNGVRNCDESEVRANWLRMLGILGCFLPEPLVKIIVSFILDECSKAEIDVWTMSEALDSLMDMFSDNDWNQISFELNLGKKSREFEKILKNKLKQQKRELGERYPAVCTVKTNLNRFSKYVEAQLHKYRPNEK